MPRTIHVLMVEDDPGDVLLTKETLKESKLSIDMVVVDDGEKALQYLRQQGPYGKAPRPDLVILDLNLPKVDGHEVLRQVKAEEALRTIPIVVVTTSDAEADIQRTYGLGANCYVTKPIGLEQFAKVVRAIEHFWMTVVALP
jgi:CheY-like chemotaxis protein